VGSSATVAFSLYMKRSNIDWVRLTFLNGANEVQAWFNLSTGTIGTVNATGIATSASASIQNIGNGWHRCVLVGAIPGQTSYTFFNTTAAADASFTRVTGGERYLWGAQLEEGSFPTSYIPTTDAAATRAADVASISGSNFSSWYRQDEGTVFADSQAYGTSSDVTLYCFDDGTTGEANQIDTRIVSGTSYRARVRSNAVSTSNINPGSFTLGASVKLGHVYRLDDCAASINGMSAVVDTSGALPLGEMNNLKLGYRGSNAKTGATIYRRLTYWPTRLPNETLQTITQ
jgi:hypothetical protein